MIRQSGEGNVQITWYDDQQRVEEVFFELVLGGLSSRLVAKEKQENLKRPEPANNFCAMCLGVGFAVEDVVQLCQWRDEGRKPREIRR